MTTSDLVGITEAAQILGLTRQGVLRRVKRGALTPVANIGNRGINVFARCEIEQLASKKGPAK